MTLAIPRDRAGTFDPKLIAKYQRRFPDFDEKIISMYARGMSTRDIQAHVGELYGIEISPELVSAVTDAVLDEVVAWQYRPLEPVYGDGVFRRAAHEDPRRRARTQQGRLPFVTQADALAVTGLELGAGVIALSILLPIAGLWWPPETVSPFVVPDFRDAVLLLVLALGLTLLPFALSLVALRHISAFTTQLAINLEPVYAILLAIPLLGEQRELTATFYFGVAILLAAVIVHFLVDRPRTLEHPEALATAEAKRIVD